MQEICYTKFPVKDLYEEGKVVVLKGWEVDYDAEYRYYLEISTMDINDPRLKEYNKIPVIPILRDGRNRGIRMSSKFTYDGLGGCAGDYAYVKYKWDDGGNYHVYCEDAISAYIYGLLFDSRIY